MFDILISKYLDGSLTPEEDIALRSIIADNPYAKEQFNLAISLHISMKDEPELHIDDEVLLQTEEMIFATLNIEVPKPIDINYHGTIRSKRRVKFTSRLVIMSLIFIAMMSSVGDLRYEFVSRGFPVAHNETNDNSDNTSAVQTVTIRNGTKNSSHLGKPKTIHSDQSNILTSIEKSVLPQNDSAGLFVNNFTNPDTSTNSINGFVPFTVAIASPLLNDRNINSNASIPSFSPINSRSDDNYRSSLKIAQSDKEQTHNSPAETHVTTKNQQSQDSKPTDNSQSLAIMHKSSVHLRSFLNNGYVYSKDNAVNATSFSQSIGYDVSEGTKVGLEMGQVGFTYAYQNTTAASANTPTSGIISVRSYSSSSQNSLLGKEENDTDSEGSSNRTTSTLSLSNKIGRAHV